MSFCPQCGKSISENELFCSSCGARLTKQVRAPPVASVPPETVAEQPSAEAKPVVGETASRGLARLMDRMPLVDDALFWIIVVAGLLLFAGISGLIVPIRPFWQSVAAFPGFVVYAALAWRRWKRIPLPDFEFLIAFLVVIFDLLITRGATGYSAMIIMANLILIYVIYRTRREKSLGEQMFVRPGPKRAQEPISPA